MTEIKLYELGPTRSARVQWILKETGRDYTSISDGYDTFKNPDLANIHPLNKLPAALFDNKPLFESAAITTYIADISPETNLISPSGTWERAQHDQWVFFALTEIEAWLWSSFLNTNILPDDQKVPAIFAQNSGFIQRAVTAMDKVLADKDYLVEDRFTVTDIIVGYTLNWVRRRDSIDGHENISKYLDRLFARPHCTLSGD